MEYTYESIKPLIIQEECEGNQVKLKFKAENQETPIETMGMAMPSQEEIMKKVMAEAAKTAASGMAINTAANQLGNLTGIDGAGSVLSSGANAAGLGYQMDTAKLMEVNLTDDLKKQTILNAFMGLSAYYQFEGGSIVYKSPV